MPCFTAMKTIGKSSYPPPHPRPPQKDTRYQTYFKLGKNQRNSATNTGEEEEEQLKPSHLPRGGVSCGNHFGKAENSTKAKHPPILMTE